MASPPSSLPPIVGLAGFSLWPLATRGGFIVSAQDALPLHQAFGLTFRSALTLPEMAVATSDCVDVEIGFAAISERLDGAVALEPWMQVLPDIFQFNTPAARYRVEAGQRVTIDPRPGAAEADIRLYLLGTVMGALCHQRGLLALHATALDWPSGAVIAAGPSGAGKSTLAAQHHARGGGVLTDDLCAIGWDSHGPVVLPGPRRLKLWSDSPAFEAWPPDARIRLTGEVEKFSLPLAPIAGRSPRAILVLRPGDQAADHVSSTAFKPLAGPEAVNALISHVFRWPLAVAMGRSQAVFAQAVALAGGRAVHEVWYSHDTKRPLRLLDALFDQFVSG